MADHPTTDLVLVCPCCERRYPQAADSAADFVNVACSLCGTATVAELVRVVDTRSRLERRTGTRRFRARVADAAGTERVLGLRSYGHAAFPFAPGEWAVVLQVGGRVRAMQDPSADRFLKIRPGGLAWPTFPAWPVIHRPAWRRPAWPARWRPGWAAAAVGVAAVAAVLGRVWPG